MLLRILIKSTDDYFYGVFLNDGVINKKDNINIYLDSYESLYEEEYMRLINVIDQIPFGKVILIHLLKDYLLITLSIDTLLKYVQKLNVDQRPLFRIIGTDLNMIFENADTQKKKLKEELVIVKNNMLITKEAIINPLEIIL